MDIIKELTLEETSLKEEMKNNCLTKGKYIDDKAKDKFKMLCHLEDFEVQYHTLNKGIDELLKKYEEEVDKCDCEQCRSCQTYHKVIQDLKSLKGE